MTLLQLLAEREGKEGKDTVSENTRETSEEWKGQQNTRTTFEGEEVVEEDDLAAAAVAEEEDDEEDDEEDGEEGFLLRQLTGRSSTVGAIERGLAFPSIPCLAFPCLSFSSSKR